MVMKVDRLMLDELGQRGKEGRSEERKILLHEWFFWKRWVRDRAYIKKFKALWGNKSPNVWEEPTSAGCDS